MNVGLSASSAPNAPRTSAVCAVIVYSNLIVRNGGRPGILNAAALDRDLRKMGATQIVVLAASFFPKEVRRFARLKWKSIQTGQNADPEILEYAQRFIRRGCDHVVVCSGDGKLSMDIVSAADARHVDVSFLSLSYKVSNLIRMSGHVVRFIDHLVTSPRLNDFRLLERYRARRAEQAATLTIH